MKSARAVVLLMMAACLGFSQSGTPAAQRLTVLVADPRGRLVSSLRADDFNLRIDDQDHRIDSVAPARDVPLAVAILLDTSGSMDRKIARASNAIEDFVATLDRRTELFLMAFADEPYLVSDTTDGRPEFISRLRRLRAAGETALYDGLREAIRKLDAVTQREERRKAILLVTDGADSASGLSYLQIMRMVRESDVTIYAAGIPQNFGALPMASGSSNFAGQVVIQGPRGGGNGPALPIPLPRGGTIPVPLPVPGTTPSPRRLPVPEEANDMGETVNMSVLEAFAEATAGGAWRVEDPARRTGEPIDRIMSRISAQLRAQYVLAFTPPHPARDRQWHEVRILLKEPDLAPRYRQEYFSR
jgi:VWFA-related protein